MPDFADFSKEVQGEFKLRDDNAPFAHYPFNQSRMLSYAGVKSEGVCRILCLLFAARRFQDPPEGYEAVFGIYRTDVEGFAKRAEAMQNIAAKTDFYDPKNAPPGADFVKLKTKRQHPLKLNSIQDVINEIMSHQAVHYISLRTASDAAGHAIAFDTRGPVIMYDPNNGWWEVRNNPTAGGFFRTWFPKWYKAMGYDVDYHGGDRRIFRYS